MKTSALIPLVAYLGLAGMSSAAPVQVAEAENHLDKRTFCIFGFGWGCNTATTTSAAPAKTSAASSVVISSAAKSSAITSSSAAAKSSAVVVISSSAKASSVAPVASSVSSAKAVSTSSASKTTSANWAQCTDFDWSAWNDKEWTWGGGFSKDYVKDWYLAEYGLAPPAGMNWRQVSSLVSKFGAKTSVSGPKTTSRYSKGCSNPWTSAAVTKTKAATTTTAKPVTTSAVVSKPAVTSAAASVSKASSAVVSSASASPSKAAASSASASVVKPSSSASSAAGPVASSAASSAAGPAASSAVSSAAGPAASSAASSAAGAASSAAAPAASSAVSSAAGAASSAAAPVASSAASSAVVDAASSSAVQAPAASPSPATPSSESGSAGNSTGVPGTGAGVPGTGSGTPGSGEGSNNGTSTTVAAPEPTQPAPVTVNGYQYGGCAQEVTGRLLADVQTSSASQTIESCTALCASYGFGVAGLEYGNECYCGTLDDVEDAAVSGECNMPCAGNANQICGGPNAINWYFDSDLTPTTVQLPAGWTTYGVVTEGTNGRLLPTLLYSGKDNTVETCAQGCAAAGYKLAGTEYSSECFCGNGFTASAGGGELVDDSAAFMACSGNLAQKCGGPSILSVTSAFGDNIPLV